jgi:hypothetical protein
MDAQRPGDTGMHQVQTLSDDEQFDVLGVVSESEPGTEELMGQVDWSLPCGSDDDMGPVDR